MLHKHPASASEETPQSTNAQKICLQPQEYIVSLMPVCVTLYRAAVLLAIGCVTNGVAAMVQSSALEVPSFETACKTVLVTFKLESKRVEHLGLSGLSEQWDELDPSARMLLNTLLKDAAFCMYRDIEVGGSDFSVGIGKTRRCSSWQVCSTVFMAQLHPTGHSV